MAETCRAPDGSKPFSFGVEANTLIMIVTTLSMSPFFFIVIFPLLVSRFGRFLGWTLRKRTEGRRAQLISVMSEGDEKKSQEKSDENASSSEEWQAVEDTDSKPSAAEGRAHKDWDGIIGLFHPFW